LNKIIPSIKKILPENRFARSVSVLAGGTAAGQLIVIAASPILTRLYTPEDFGLLAVYTGILGILGVVASLRYQLAIPLPESDKDAASIALLSLLIVVFTTLITTVAVWLIGPEIADLLNTPALEPYLWLVPIGLFLTGTYQVFQYWAIRTQEFSNIARTRLTQSLGMVVTQIAGYALGPIALLLGRGVGQGAGMLALMRSALRHSPKEFEEASSQSIRRNAREHKHFPLVSIWTGLASAGGSNIPPILIAAFLGVGPAGMFALSHRVLSQPMAIIGRAVGDVFYREAAEAHRKGKLGQTVDRVYSSLSVLMLPPAVAVFLVVPEVFVFVFGDEWGEAGEIARWMVPWLFFQLVVTPSTRVFPILGLHGIALRFQLSLLFSTVFSIILGSWVLKDLVLTVILISFLNASIYLCRAIHTYGLVGLKKLRPVLVLIKTAPLALLCNAPLVALLVWYEKIIDTDFINVLFISISLIALITSTILSFNKVKA
jgi:O-antigen/teichoic acid export membrane protein